MPKKKHKLFHVFIFDLFNVFEKTGKMGFKKEIFKDTSVNIILEVVVWFCLYSFAYYGLLFA